MFDVHVRIRPIPNGSAMAELVNRDDLIDFLRQAAARGIHQDKGPPVEPYDPAEPEYSDAPADTLNIAGVSVPKPPKVEHLKAEFSEDERRQVRRGGRVPQQILIPADAIKTGLTEDVIKVELFKLLPECCQLNMRIEIFGPMKHEEQAG
jgi:hypothetical protein